MAIFNSYVPPILAAFGYLSLPEGNLLVFHHEIHGYSILGCFFMVACAA